MEGWVVLGYLAMHRPGVELAIFRLQVRHPNHYTTELRNEAVGCFSVSCAQCTCCMLFVQIGRLKWNWESTSTAFTLSANRQWYIVYCIFSARQHAERAICYRKSVCLSVCLSVTRVDQSKTVEVRIMQFSPYSSPIPLLCALFHPEILTGSHRAGALNDGGLGKRANIVRVLTLSPGGSTS